MTSRPKSRVQAGVREGGQFATMPKGEPDVALAGATRGNLPEGHEVAFRNQLADHPKWLHGTVTYDAPLADGNIAVLVRDEGESGTYIIAAETALPYVEPSEYAGDDADTMAEAFGWSSDDWGYYYDARAEQEQTDAYRNGFEEGAAAARREIAENGLEHPAGVGRVQVWVAEHDGTPVFQIDTDGERGGRVRVNLNDAPIWDGNPDVDESTAVKVEQLLGDYQPFTPFDDYSEDSREEERREDAYRAHLENAAAKLDAIYAILRKD